jgi:hypothetical protein
MLNKQLTEDNDSGTARAASTLKQDTSAPFTCTRDDCPAVLPTEGARRSHIERDHDDTERDA